jgi:hypothetical protein
LSHPTACLAPNCFGIHGNTTVEADDIPIFLATRAYANYCNFWYIEKLVSFVFSFFTDKQFRSLIYSGVNEAGAYGYQNSIDLVNTFYTSGNAAVPWTTAVR